MRRLSNIDNARRNERRPSAWANSGCRGAALLVVAAVLQGCVLSQSLESVGADSHASSWVRPDNAQEQIGKREHPVVVAKYGGEYANPKVESLLAVIVGRLVAASEDKARIYKVTILNSPKVNAFALPGGYLYVTRGLIALANDTAELAAVLSHEMAHVSANHAILRGQAQTSSAIGKQVVSEVLGPSVAGQVALAANQLRLANFSKDQELQADAIGIRLLGRAGFDAHGAARFLDTMQAYQALQSRRSEKFSDITFLSSHPSTPQRVTLAKKHARFFGAPGTGEADRERYLKGVDGLLFGDSADEGFVRGGRFSHLGLGVTFHAPDAAKMENQATAVVVTGPADLATRFDAAVLPRGQSLAAYMKSGWINGLDEASISEHEINGLKAARAVARGGDWKFVIRVIKVERQVYRFITAGPAGSEAVEAASRSIAGTFRLLSDTEKASLQPLRLRVVAVTGQDTLASLASRMKGTDNALRLFRTLNGLRPGELPEPGTKVKIVSDR